MGVLIASTFRATLAEALAAAEAATKASMPSNPRTPEGYISFEALQVMTGPEATARTRAIADDLLEVIAEIQHYRDREPDFDTFLRQRGIVTRVRSVR